MGYGRSLGYEVGKMACGARRMGCAKPGGAGADVALILGATIIPPGLCFFPRPIRLAFGEAPSPASPEKAAPLGSANAGGEHYMNNAADL